MKGNKGFLIGFVCVVTCMTIIEVILMISIGIRISGPIIERFVGKCHVKRKQICKVISIDLTKQDSNDSMNADNGASNGNGIKFAFLVEIINIYIYVNVIDFEI